LDIYPARELPMVRYNVRNGCCQKSENPNKKLISKNDLIPSILAQDAKNHNWSRGYWGISSENKRSTIMKLYVDKY